MILDGSLHCVASAANNGFGHGAVNPIVACGYNLVTDRLPLPYPSMSRKTLAMFSGVGDTTYIAGTFGNGFLSCSSGNVSVILCFRNSDVVIIVSMIVLASSSTIKTRHGVDVVFFVVASVEQFNTVRIVLLCASRRYNARVVLAI